MSFVPDMSEEDGRVAIGWLHPDQPYRQGEVPPEFLERLKQFSVRWGDSVEALGWGAACGYHTCEFCGRAWGSGTFGVPFGGWVLHAPEMVAHYVEHHGYAPPSVFVAAVLSCPLPGTPEYVSAVGPFARHDA